MKTVITSATCIVMCAVMSACAPFFTDTDRFDVVRKLEGGNQEFACQRDTLENAQNCAFGTLNAIESRLQELGIFRETEKLALIALGILAGTYVATDGPSGPIKSFTVAAASILGLDSAVGADDQRTVLNAGFDALYCVIRLDQSLGKVDNNSSRITQMGGSGILTDGGSAGPLAVLPFSTLSTAEKQDPLVSAYAQRASDLAVIATDAWQTFVVSSADETGRAQALAAAVDQIRHAIRSNLAKLSNLNDIFSATSTAAQGGAKDVAEKHDALVAQLNLTAFSSTGGLASEYMAKNAATMLAVKAIAAITDDANNTYEQCVLRATPQPKLGS